MSSFSINSQNVLFCSIALFFNTMTAPLVKLTQNAAGKYDYNKWCVYFFSELIKLLVAMFWCLTYHTSNEDRARSHLAIESGDFAQYAVPGFVFFAQNNLSFLALQHMDPSAFQLLMNTRIISVALLSVSILKKSMNTIEWISIVLLTVGAMQYQLSGCTTTGYRIDTEGLAVMFIIVMCAAGGNVYTQKVMQKKMDQPLMLQNAMLYVWGIFFNGINWLISISRTRVAFGNVGFIQIFSMVFYAVYGLSISIILKRFGAITRTFINTAAIYCTYSLKLYSGCTAFVDVIFFDSKITVLEMTTFIVISTAVFSYTVVAKQFVPAVVSDGSKM